MRILADPDATQLAIIPHLRVTEELLARAASTVSGRPQSAEILPMPDLGLPHNVRRIHGGFFTGACYRWESDVPIVPVDATVNVCGVALFRTSTEFSSESEFRERIRQVRRIWEKRTGFVWNYDTGNHFIIYGEVRQGRTLPRSRYLALHASTAEFKSQYNGLYPSPGNWYSEHIRYVEGKNNRYLRYLSGRIAERFYDMAAMLERYQVQRQRLMAGLVLGEDAIEEEVLSLPHYGMPDQNSVAIGCQWSDPDDPYYLLLTRPHAPLYLIRGCPGGSNVVPTDSGARLITPHGLGVRYNEPPDIHYLPDALVLAGKRFEVTGNLRLDGSISIRDFSPDRDLPRVLDACPGDVQEELVQIYSHFWKENS